MGGSGGGGGISIDTIDSNCAGPVSFLVICKGGLDEIWDKCQVGDDVQVVLDKAVLPVLEVRRINDRLKLGIVPAQQSKIIRCISDGWKYSGKITKKEGNEFAPQITVELRGEE